MRIKMLKALSVFFVLFFLNTGIIFADGLSSIGFLGGYMHGDLKSQPDYEVIPLMASFGLDLNPLIEKIGLHTEGILEYQIEPFLSPIIEPSANIETGINFLFKYAFPLCDWLMPYVKIGTGLSYMSLHTREQSTQFNFVSSGCGGVSLYIKDDVSIDCEYRFRHLSNCSIDHPNSGINTESYLIGVSFHFD